LCYIYIIFDSDYIQFCTKNYIISVILYEYMIHALKYLTSGRNKIRDIFLERTANVVMCINYMPNGIYFQLFFNECLMT